MTRLLAMRHGETEWNAARRMQGHGDSPLTPRGREQAVAAAEILAGQGIERIVASDLGRAVDTAAPIAARLRLPVETASLWRELDLGDLTGQPAAALASAAGYRRHPGWRCPGGESLLDLRARVLGALEALTAVPRTTLVVTHHGVLRVLLAEAAGTPAERLLEVAVPPAFIGAFPLRDGLLGPPAVLRG